MDLNSFFKKKKTSDDKDTEKKAQPVQVDIDSVKDKAMSLLTNKKAIISIATVAVLGVGYYTYDAFLKPPEYKPLPNITITTKNSVNKQQPVKPKPVKVAVKVNKETTQNNNKSSIKGSLPVSKVPVPKLNLPGVDTDVNRLVKKNTQAIVTATKQQERELFDIFKIEPGQEYQIDRLISLAKKQDNFLAIEQSILQKKVKIEKLLGQLQEKANREKELIDRVSMLTNEINKLKEKLNKQNRTQYGRNKLSEKNPFPFPMPEGPSPDIMSANAYIKELNGVSVGIIYDYQNKKMAVINNNGRIYKAGIGDKITQHFIVKEILPSGIIVSISKKAKGVFLPLAMSPITKQKTHFGTVNRKSGGEKNISEPYSSSSGNGGSTPSSMFVPPPNMSTPPVQ